MEYLPSLELSLVKVKVPSSHESWSLLTSDRHHISSFSFPLTKNILCNMIICGQIRSSVKNIFIGKRGNDSRIVEYINRSTITKGLKSNQTKL